MSTYGFVYDQNLCIGCNACQMACKDGHNLGQGLFFRRVITAEYTDPAGVRRALHYSGSCNHCQDAACLAHCPTGALYRQSDGTVGHNADRCIGCGTCTWACPYGAPGLDHKTGRAGKCDACFQRRQEGREPLCVEACLTHCLRFVDLDTLTPEERARGTATLPILPDPRQTTPRLCILTKGGTPHDA